jgi:glutathione synthase/RimK-type ligase-like ATP-grasp enzyme
LLKYESNFFLLNSNNFNNSKCFGSTMLVGLYKSSFPDYQITRNEIYKRILRHNNIDFIELNIDELDFWIKVKKVDLFLFRWAHVDDHHQLVSSILPVIENYLKIKCFPNLKTCWHYDDKIKQYYLLRSLGYPVIESYIFWEQENALAWVEKVDYPIVFKIKSGAGSSNVVLIKNKKEATQIINRMFSKGILSAYGIPHKGKIKYKNFENFIRQKIDKYILNKIKHIRPTVWQISKNYVLFQRFLPNNKFDTRITTIGNRAFGYRRFVRDNDFRASGSGKIDHSNDVIDKRFIKLALQISKELEFQSMAYDFLLNEHNQPEICEISYTYVDKLIYKCPGYWDENLLWHPGNFWPQYLHVKDSLNLENLNQPKIEDITS